MEGGSCLLEQGEAAPLLQNQKCEDGASDINIGGRPSEKDQCGGGSRVVAIILGFECLESLGFFGMGTNLVVYLSSVMHESNASTATSITTWAGTSLLTPFLGAVIADSYCGSYWMILVSSLIDLCGMVLITVSACLPTTTHDQSRIILYSGLYLVAFGSGGIKSSLLPLGADHIRGAGGAGDDDDDPAEQMMREESRKASFFNWFYMCMSVGALVSSTLVVWVQENVGWVPGFGMPTLCMAVGVVAFACGTKAYNKVQRPSSMGSSTSSPVIRALQVVVASLCKMNAEVPPDGSLLYHHEEGAAGSSSNVPAGAHHERLEHTAGFRCLDKAAVVLDSDTKHSGGSHHPWRLCTVTQVEELKTLLRLLPIWLTNIAHSVAYAQMYTTFIEQAKSMDATVCSFHVPPASLFAFETLCVMVWVVLYDAAIAPRGLSQLRRMGVGYALMAQAMAAAALVEVSRKQQARRHISRDGGRASTTSIAWLLPQFFLVGGSEVFTNVGQLEFFHGEAPSNMRNLCTALSMLAIALGNFLSSAVVAVVASATAAGGSPGWIPDDLDQGHLDYFFWAMAGLCAGNLLAFCVCARRYTSKKIFSQGENCNL